MPEALILAVAVAVGSEPAPGDAPPVPVRPPLQTTFLAGAWLTRVDGRSSLGGGEIELADQLDLSDHEAALNLELALRRHDVWELRLSGFDFSTDSSGAFVGDAVFGTLDLDDGDPFRASVEISSVAAELTYTVWRPYAAGGQQDAGAANLDASGRYVADLRFSPGIGLRYTDVDETVASGGARARSGGEWAAPLAVFDVTLDYRPREVPFLKLLRMEGALGVGPALGGDGGILWQLRAGLTLQVTELFGIMIGYRLVELDVENDDYSLNGGLQGLFLAGSLRF